MKHILSFLCAILFASSVMTQTVTLTFTGRDANNGYCQLNSHKLDKELAVNAIECMGTETKTQAASQTTSKAKGAAKGSTANPFSFGDQMEYVGYATFNGAEVESQRIQQMQGASQTFIMQFNEVQPIYGQPCPNAATVTDYDGNVYNTVQIGQQCWMRENLKTTHYANGTSIALGSSISTTIAYRYYPNNNSSNVSTYGYLYNWKAVMNNSSSSSSNPSGVQGICPNGWHVPSDAEWTQLENYVSSQSQYVCGSNSSYIAKALASTAGWNSYSVTCSVGDTPSNNNATGFSAVPAGYYGSSYGNFGYDAIYWSSTEYDGYYACYRSLYYGSANVDRASDGKYLGLSVRCLRD